MTTRMVGKKRDSLANSTDYQEEFQHDESRDKKKGKRSKVIENDIQMELAEAALQPYQLS